MKRTIRNNILLVMFSSLVFTNNAFANSDEIIIDISSVKKTEEEILKKMQSCNEFQTLNYIQQVLKKKVIFSDLNKEYVDDHISMMNDYKKCGGKVKSFFLCHNWQVPELGRDYTSRGKSNIRFVGLKFNDNGIYRYGLVGEESRYVAPSYLKNGYPFKIFYQEIDQNYIKLLNELAEKKGKDPVEFYEIDEDVYKAMKNSNEVNFNSIYPKNFVGGITYKKTIYEDLENTDELGGVEQKKVPTHMVFRVGKVFRETKVKYVTGLRPESDEKEMRLSPTNLRPNAEEFERCLNTSLN